LAAIVYIWILSATPKDLVANQYSQLFRDQNHLNIMSGKF